MKRSHVLTGTALIVLLLLVALTWIFGSWTRPPQPESQPTAAPPSQEAAPSPPKAAPPFPTAAPPSGAFGEIEKVMQGLPFGSVAFKAPSEMGMGTTQTVRVLLSGSESSQQLQAKLDSAVHGQPSAEGHSIRIAPRMEALLTGANFVISAAQPSIQAINPEQVTQWQWDVTAKKGGSQQLHLAINALISVDGHSDTPVVFRVLDRTINVRVSNYRLVTDYLRNNWTWLGGLLTLIGGFFAWLLKRGKPEPGDAKP